VCAAPPASHDQNHGKAEKVVPGIWWLQVKWSSPTSVGEELIDRVEASYAEWIAWLNHSPAPQLKQPEAKPFEIIINKGVMSGNPG